MARTKVNWTPGEQLQQRLDNAIRTARCAPFEHFGNHLVRLKGLDLRGDYLLPVPYMMGAVAMILVGCKRVYKLGNEVVMLEREGNVRMLKTLKRDSVVDPGASANISNIFICEVDVKDTVSFDFLPPRAFVEAVLHNEEVLTRLPRIELLAMRPVFDRDFILLSPGWHPESRTLVLGDRIEPSDFRPRDATLPLIERLPPHLCLLLGGFCFRASADLANAVAAMMTSLLVNHFVQSSKPVVMIDGNQPGLGKTLLARILGILLDGHEPSLLHFCSDESELSKRICATLRSGQSIVPIDNAKVIGGGRVSSAVLEANAMAPVISLRILGQSANFTRPNDLIWAITMNDTRVSPDLVSRSLPVRLHFDGDPGQRAFSGPDPIAYAMKHRAAILSELAGMIVYWNQQGRPLSGHTHRCHEWARLIGGIMTCAGMPEFLANLAESRSDFDQALDDLTALAEVAVRNPATVVENFDVTNVSSEGPGQRASKFDSCKGLLPGEWESLFRTAKILIETLDGARSQRARSTIVGNFLGRHIDRAVPLWMGERSGTATLRCVSAGSRQRRFWFDVAWSTEPHASIRPAAPTEVAADSGDPDAICTAAGQSELAAVPEGKTRPPAPPDDQADLGPFNGGNNEAW